MSRAPLAILAFLIGISLYLVAVLALADWVQGWHWLAQVPFFLIAGTIWAWPTKALMVWAAAGPRKTPPA